MTKSGMGFFTSFFAHVIGPQVPTGLGAFFYVQYTHGTDRPTPVEPSGSW